MSKSIAAGSIPVGSIDWSEKCISVDMNALSCKNVGPFSELMNRSQQRKNTITNKEMIILKYIIERSAFSLDSNKVSRTLSMYLISIFIVGRREYLSNFYNHIEIGFVFFFCKEK